MLLNKVIDSYVTLHYEIARIKIDAHLSFSTREALGIRLPSMRRNKSFKKQKYDDLSQSHCQHLWKIPGKNIFPRQTTPLKQKFEFFTKTMDYPEKVTSLKLLRLLLLQPTTAFFFYFLDNIGKENVFYDILERKNVSLSCKNNKLKKSKN